MSRLATPRRTGLSSNRCGMPVKSLHNPILGGDANETPRPCQPLRCGGRDWIMSFRVSELIESRLLPSEKMARSCGGRQWLSKATPKQASSGRCHANGSRERPSPVSLAAWLSSDTAASLPARDHPARDLALSPLHPELSRRGGSACRTWARHLPRNRPELGAEVWTGDCTTVTAAPPSAERSMAPRRCVTNTSLENEDVELYER
jgi:hypothetical protein